MMDRHATPQGRPWRRPVQIQFLEGCVIMDVPAAVSTRHFSASMWAISRKARPR